MDGGTFVPLYEARMAHHFDHRWSTYDGLQTRDLSLQEKDSPSFLATPRYWVPQSAVDERLAGRWSNGWLIGWRDVCRVTHQRTMIASMVPRVATNNKLLLMLPDVEAEAATTLYSILASFAFDYLTRQKLGGAALNYFVMKQLPVPDVAALSNPATNSTFHDSLPFYVSRALELIFTASDIQALATDLTYDGPPFHWFEERRRTIRCELDAACFHMYLGPEHAWGVNSPDLREHFPTPRSAVDYIMETFTVSRRNDVARTANESSEGGRFITKETILAIYDEMAEAIRTGQPYQTRLDPPPGPPTDAEGNFIPIAEWDENNWPSHIHRPREESEVST